MAVDLETLFPNLVNLLLDPVFVVDEAGTIVFISAACERLLGYTADELIGTSLMDKVHPDDLERTLKAASRVMSGQPHIGFENRYLRKDGQTVHIQWSARWAETDRVRIAVARDVTALRHADQTREALYSVSQAAHSAENLSDLCREIHRVIGGLLSTDDLYVAFYDRADNTLSYPYLSEDRQASWVAGPLPPDTAMARVIDSGQPLLGERDEARPGLGAITDEVPGAVSWLGVPLLSGDRVLGAVVIESDAPFQRRAVQDRDLLQFVATQLVTAVERKQVEENLRFMAHYDSLTGLTNRSLFLDRLETALRRARREEEQLALLYLDLDAFKAVNDTLGHAAGDEVLREVARRLKQCTREADTVARMGGDEFTILLTSVPDARAVDAMVHKIRDVMSVDFEFDGQSLPMDFSIGTALYPQDGDEAASLLRRADAGMYGMKRERSRQRRRVRET